eukprot:SAG11_NODE_8320_length_1029_cov_1.769892_1_plen_71_part_00
MTSHTWSIDDLGDEGEAAFEKKATPQRPSISEDGVLSIGDIGAVVTPSWEGPSAAPSAHPPTVPPLLHAQ